MPARLCTITHRFNTFSTAESPWHRANGFYEDTSRKCCQDNPARDKYSYRPFSHRVIGISYFRPSHTNGNIARPNTFASHPLITWSQESPSLQIAHGKFVFAWLLCMPHPIQTFVLAVSSACTFSHRTMTFPKPVCDRSRRTKSPKYFYQAMRLPASTFRDIILSLMFYH